MAEAYLWGCAHVLRRSVADCLAVALAAPPSCLLPKARPHDTLVASAIQEMRQRRLTTPAKVVAKEIGVSTRTLERSFLGAVGRTPQAVLRMARDVLTAHLLRAGLSAARVAATLDYADPISFSHAVRRRTGRSPLASVGRSACHRMA
jgi:transcriptional regulator GlxA family with amidase domain